MNKTFWLCHPIFVIYRLFPRILPDSLFLKCQYFMRLGKKLDLKNPKTFNEKLQWLKLHDRKPEYTMMVDKYEVKKYVAEKIGEQYVIPTLGVWNHFDEIDFDSLPDQFVLKCTHDSGGLVIVKDKNSFDKDAAKEKIEKCLKNNYYWKGREWPYKNVFPRIIAEQYLDAPNKLVDYKFMCFNGICKLIFTVTNRFSDNEINVTFFSTKWEKLDFERHYKKDPETLKKPENLEEMLMISQKLSENHSFSRMDLYENRGKVYFGEITFYPGSGVEEFSPEDYDTKLGNLIELPSKIYKQKANHTGGGHLYRYC